MSSSTNRSSFPRFPATSRIAGREKRSIVLVNNSTNSPLAAPPENDDQQQSYSARGSGGVTLPSISNNNNRGSSSLLVQPGVSSVPVASASPLALVPVISNATALASIAASVLTDVSTRYNGTFTTQDLEVEQQRRAFFRVVEKVATEAEHCKSAAVFCETLFMHVKQSIDSASALSSRAGTAASGGLSSSASASSPSPDDFAGLRIASACWALDVIGRSNTSFSFILQDIKRLLFPAVFVGYNAVDDTCKQRAKTNPSVAGSTALIASAPYLVCDLFYQRYARDQRRIRQLAENKEVSTAKLQRNKSGAGSMVRILNRQLIATIFRAWRGHVRKSHIERFARDTLRRNGFRESRSTKLDAAFSRWRLMVEQNRSATLTERCHHLANQIENAKGQFQLQCFRADKYLRVVEELREELRGARDTREELHKENIRLQAQLESFQVQARERLEAHVSLLCGELHKWRSYVAGQDREDRERVDASMKFCDRMHSAVKAISAVGGSSRSPSVSPAAAALDPEAGDDEDSSAFDLDGSKSAGGGSRSGAGSPSGFGDAMDSNADSHAALNFSAIAATVASASAKSEATLLQWCTWAVQQCPIATMKSVTNFSTDFINGEAIIVAMNVAAPHHVSLMLLQDLHPIRRLERALESGKKAGLTQLPKVQDFAEGTADLIVLCVAEIFHLWCSRSRLVAGDGEAVKDPNSEGAGKKGGKKGKKSKSVTSTTANEDNNLDGTTNSLAASGGGVVGDGGDGDSSAMVLAAAEEGDPPPVVTVDDLAKYLDECTLALDKFRDNHKVVITKDRTLWRLELGALTRAAFIARERQEGRAVTVLDRKDMVRFTKFQKQRFNNLQNRYRMPPLDYSGPPWMSFELQLDLLRESLHNFYADLRRVFTYYCNGAPTMGSAGYWSFCNDIRVTDPRTITRSHLDRVFVMANLEDISTASVDPLLSFEDDLLNEAAEADEDENTETQLIPSEFVECVIRIADLRVRDRMLHDKFAALMKDFVNQYACKSETDKFRREINSTAILAVTDKYRKDTGKIFTHFSHRKPGGAGGGSKTRFMSVGDFVFFAKESMLASTTLDEAAITQIFEKVASPSDDLSGRELHSHEFMDALVCVSFFKYPSPFVLLEKKIELTLQTLIGFLRGRLKGLVTLSKQQSATESGMGSPSATAM